SHPSPACGRRISARVVVVVRRSAREHCRSGVDTWVYDGAVATIHPDVAARSALAFVRQFTARRLTGTDCPCRHSSNLLESAAELRLVFLARHLDSVVRIAHLV